MSPASGETRPGAVAGVVVRAMRVPFLALTPVCVGLGVACAIEVRGSVEGAIALLALAGALCAHIAVNLLNEYEDFRSGLDLTTDRTPFSGGSGALPQRPGAAGAVLAAGIAALIATAMVGVALVWRIGPGVIGYGVVGLAIVVTYTRWLNRYPLLCLVAPGIGFGPLMVTGTALVLGAGSAPLPVIASMVPFFLVSNLLLLNQYPDIEPDRAIGRRHFPITIGVRACNRLYAGAAVAAAIVIGASVGTGLMPARSLVALVPLLGAVVAFTGAEKHADGLPGLHQALPANVVTTLLTPAILAATLL